MSATLSGNTGPLGNNAGGGISAAAAAVLTLARLHNSSFLQRQSRSARTLSFAVACQLFLIVREPSYVVHTDAIRMPGHLGSVRSVCFSPTVRRLRCLSAWGFTLWRAVEGSSD